MRSFGLVVRFAPAVADSLDSPKGGELVTELTSSRSNTTNGDATAASGADEAAGVELWIAAS